MLESRGYLKSGEAAIRGPCSAYNLVLQESLLHDMVRVACQLKNMMGVVSSTRPGGLTATSYLLFGHEYGRICEVTVSFCSACAITS